MSEVVKTLVGTANVKDTLSETRAGQALSIVLRSEPTLLGLEEWTASRHQLLHQPGYSHARPEGGGAPAMWRHDRMHLLRCHSAVIAPAENVGHLAGRRDNLPASRAAVYVFDDLALRVHTTLIVIHLTAEVQTGGHYRTDQAHAARVRRHQLERANVERIVRHQQRNGRRVYVVGDTNYDGMTLPPLKACWLGHDKAEHAGTLGNRSVDYVYAVAKAVTVQTLSDPSDHDAVIATYADVVKGAN